MLHVGSYIGMSEINSQCLALDRYNKQLTEMANVYNTLGEQEKAFIIGKSIRIIDILYNHCMSYGIGVPSNQIANIVSEKR
jgi:hypothetical protein